jgi:hypothetical protein
MLNFKLTEEPFIKSKYLRIIEVLRSLSVLIYCSACSSGVREQAISEPSEALENALDQTSEDSLFVLNGTFM